MVNLVNLDRVINVRGSRSRSGSAMYTVGNPSYTVENSKTANIEACTCTASIL